VNSTKLLQDEGCTTVHVQDRLKIILHSFAELCKMCSRCKSLMVII